MQRPWLWPVLTHDDYDVWWWRLCDGELLGQRLFSSLDENGSACRVNLGPAGAFDVGFAGRNQLRVLLQRPSDGAGCRLELIRPDGGGGRAVDVLGDGLDDCFPHFIPGRSLKPAGNQKQDHMWQPGWLQGSAVRTGIGDISAEHIRKITWIAPTGAPTGDWWGFEGISCDGTAVAGVLGPASKGQLWRAGSCMVPLLPAYCHNSRLLYYLAAFWQDDRSRAGVVGRHKPGPKGSQNEGDWSASRLQWSWPLSAPDADVEVSLDSTFGGAISCPASDDLMFWSPFSEQDFCLQGGLTGGSVRIREEFVQVRPVGQYGGVLSPQPVRVRGVSCEAASDRWECFTAGWGVQRAGGFSLLSVPPGCPLAPGKPRVTRPPALVRRLPLKPRRRRRTEPESQNEPPRRADDSSRLRGLRRAMAAALAEVENLRKKNSQLREKLSETDRQ